MIYIWKDNNNNTLMVEGNNIELPFETQNFDVNSPNLITYDNKQEQFRLKTETELVNEQKQIKLQQVSKTFEDTIANGYFFSQSLQIDIDCRRSDIKNDLQNVDNLITFLTSTNTQTIDVYRGYTNPETNETQYAYNVTLEQLQQVKLEMIQYGLQLYNRKWQLEDLINNASTLSDLNNISIDFTIH